MANRYCRYTLEWTDFEETHSSLASLYASGYETAAKRKEDKETRSGAENDNGFAKELMEWSARIRQWAGKRSNDNLELPNPKRRLVLHDSFLQTHDGNQAQAKLSLLSSYSNKHAKWALQRRKRNETGNWRESLRSAMTLVSGDYRTSKYTSPTMDWDADIPTCDAAVKYAEACLSAIKSKKRTLRLSDLSRFLEMAVCLHLGEEADEVMEDLTEIFFESRELRANLLDLWGQNGVDVETIRKQVDNAEKRSRLEIEELPEMKRQSLIVMEWQKKLENVYSEFSTTDEKDDRDDVSSLEELRELARSHGFRSKGLVGVEQKLDRAKVLCQRIAEWKSGPAETVKFVSAIVREVHRLKMRSPGINGFLTFHQKASDWVDRANIAIRSRISLDEIRDLIQTGNSLPLDLSEYLEKLESRVEMSDRWLHDFAEALDIDGYDKAAIINKLRSELAGDGNYAYLQELATDGGSIPVEVDSINILQVELDAHTWTAKAKKWLPDSDGAKCGRLEELHDHVSKGAALRERLPLPKEDKAQWTLECEAELKSIVSAADRWLETHHDLVEGEDETSYSLKNLRRIVNEGEAIYANLGSGALRISKMLTQAENWHGDFQSLLLKCGIGTTAPPTALVEISELRSAMDSARERVFLHLEEVAELEAVVEKIERWQHQCALVLGEKRQAKGNKFAPTMETVKNLIAEAGELPVNTASYVARLENHCRMVRDWQASSLQSLQDIVSGFQDLRFEVNKVYGEPSAYVRDASKDNVQPADVLESEPVSVPHSDKMDIDETNPQGEDCSSQCDASASSVVSDIEEHGLEFFANRDCTVRGLVAKFYASSKFTCLVTHEKTAALQLEKVTHWCMKSIKYLENTRDVFDKRFFGAFDRLLKEGRLLVNNAGASSALGSDPALPDRVAQEWRQLVSDQLERLGRLFDDRNDFITLCKNADKLMGSDDKRPPIEKLRSLDAQSHNFPAACGSIVKLRSLTSDANTWIETVKKTLDSGNKMTLQEATALFSQGEQLWFVSPELKTLRDGLKAAKSWARKAKRCKVHHSAADNEKIEALALEHENLIIKLPAELARLQQAMRNYCICQRPYEGFMIGCDECDDWFHGACVGVSQARADKVSKYLCVRCSIKKSYKSSASTVADIIRKWTCEKDLKKARHNDTQKFKRRFRKETKDIDNLQKEESLLRRQLAFVLAHESRYPYDGKAVGTHPQIASDGRHVSGVVNGQAAPVHHTEACQADKGIERLNDTSSTQIEQSHVVAADEQVVVPLPSDSCASTTKTEESAPAPIPREDTGQEPNRTESMLPAPSFTDRSAQTGAKITAPPEKSLESREVDVIASVSTESLASTDQNGRESGNGEASVHDTSCTLASGLNPEDIALMGPYIAMEPSAAKASIVSQLRTLQDSMKVAQNRVSALTQQAEDLRKTEDFEDSRSGDLRMWVIRLRSLVLTPQKSELATASKPSADGSLSLAMLSVLDEAKSFGLQDLKDIRTVENQFKCLAWCLRAMDVFTAKPKSVDVVKLTEEAATLNIPYEKTTRALKSMSQRGINWENKASKALSPVPGMKKPYNVKALKELAELTKSIPLQLQYEDRLANVIDDGGNRYCLCGGPNDGRFMVGCECGLWYHGRCVGVAEDSDELKNWKCPRCLGAQPESFSSFSASRFHEQYDVESASEDSDSDEEVVVESNEEMWPPFGLFGSESAQKALGPECSAIPDCVASAVSPSVSYSSQTGHSGSSFPVRSSGDRAGPIGLTTEDAATSVGGACHTTAHETTTDNPEDAVPGPTTQVSNNSQHSEEIVPICQPIDSVGAAGTVRLESPAEEIDDTVNRFESHIGANKVISDVSSQTADMLRTSEPALQEADMSTDNTMPFQSGHSSGPSDPMIRGEKDAMNVSPSFQSNSTLANGHLMDTGVAQNPKAMEETVNLYSDPMDTAP